MLYESIPSGYRGTAQTIRRMHELVRFGVMGIGPTSEPDDRIVRLAREIVQNVAAKDYVGEVAAILAWVQANVRYVRDPYTPGGIERLQHPAITLFESKQEDCDSMAVAFSALAAAIGNPWAFRTVSVDPLDPGEFVHVYSMVNVGGFWRPADPTFPNATLGWEVQDDDPRIAVGVPRAGAVATSRKDWAPT